MHVIAYLWLKQSYAITDVIVTHDAGELEGDVGGDIVEGIVDDFLNGSIELQECHAPKPVLLASGEASILV